MVLTETPMRSSPGRTADQPGNLQVFVRKIERRVGKGMEEKPSTPDDAFLIEQVVDDFDAVAELGLSPLGHRENGADKLAGFDFVQVGNAVVRPLLQL
jgi:hypothetical protein